MPRPFLLRSDIFCAHCQDMPEGVAHYGVSNGNNPKRNRIHAIVVCHGAEARLRIPWTELDKAKAEGRKIVLFEDEPTAALQDGPKRIAENRTFTIDITSACD